MKNLIKTIIATGALGLALLTNSGCSTLSFLDVDRTCGNTHKLGCSTFEYKGTIQNNSEHSGCGFACYCDHNNQGPIVGTIQRFGERAKTYCQR